MKPWKITYKEMPWDSIIERGHFSGMGFYEITFDGSRYGFISKEAWDKKTTGDILSFVECMLNDAHDMATRESPK